MAALRIFARSKLATVLRSSALLDSSKSSLPILYQVDKRWTGFIPKGVVQPDKEYTDYEVSKDPKEWEYVTRLLRPKIVPEPSSSTDLPSGWKPRTCTPTDYPYFIQRTRNHMYPVYLMITFRGTRKVTHIRKIHGDIWALHKDLREYIKEVTRGTPGFRVNELAGDLKIRGDYVSVVKHWMEQKGF